jgi:hypothetical protein
MTDALTSIDELIAKWRREGVPLLPPHDEREIVEALSRTGRPFSRDLVSLYSATGGMEDAMDDNSLCLWTLERLVAERLKEPRTLLLFMDFLLDSHCYGLRYEDEETSSVHIEHFDGRTPPPRVADSLDEFIRLYLSDPSRIFL